MSRLIKALQEAPKKTRTIEKWMQDQDPEDRSAIDDAILEGAISIAELRRILREESGFPFGNTALKDYARRLRESAQQDDLEFKQN